MIDDHISTLNPNAPQIGLMGNARYPAVPFPETGIPEW